MPAEPSGQPTDDVATSNDEVMERWEMTWHWVQTDEDGTSFVDAPSDETPLGLSASERGVWFAKRTRFTVLP